MQHIARPRHRQPRRSNRPARRDWITVADTLEYDAPLTTRFDAVIDSLR